MAATEDRGAAAHGLTAEEDRRRYCPWRRRKIYGAAGGCGVLVVGEKLEHAALPEERCFPLPVHMARFWFCEDLFLITGDLEQARPKQRAVM